MKPQKFDNLIGFLDVLFIFTMTFVALFVLAILQIKQIEVTVEEHQQLAFQYEQAIADLKKIKDKLDATNQQFAHAETTIASMQATITQRNARIAKAEQETQTQQQRAEQLASKVKELDQQVAQLRGVGNWRSTAKVAIEITWPKIGNGLEDDDIDIYIQSPNNQVTYFGNRIGPGLFIDRDDMGDAAITNIHNEITQFFTLLDGSEKPYLVNLRIFKKNTNTPTPVTFKLYHITETNAEIVFEKTYTMSAQGDVQPTVEIFTKPSESNSRNHEYKSFRETTIKIDKIHDYAVESSNQQTSQTTTPPSTRPVTRLAPTREPLPTSPPVRRVIIKPEDQDPRFQVDGPTSTTTPKTDPLVPVPNRSTKDNQ